MIGLRFGWKHAKFGAAIGAMLLAASAASAQPVSALRLSQVSWFNMPNSIGADVPNSEYGDLHFNYAAPAVGLSFVNVIARPVGSTDAPAWLVQNHVLPNASILGQSSFQASQVVNLEDLGVTRGMSASGTPIEYEVFYSPVPAAAQPVGPMSQVLTLGSQRYRFGGAVEAGNNSSPGLSSPKRPPAKTPWNGDFTIRAAWRFGLPNEEQGKDQCGPAALANSFHWMAARYPDQIDLGDPPQTWVQTLMKFKTYTNWEAPIKDANGNTTNDPGVTAGDMVRGKLRFAQDPTKNIPDNFEVRYQSNTLPASITEGTMTASRVGAAAAPTFEFLLTELQAGADVELWVDWLDNQGNGGRGAHIVSVVGALQFGNKMFVWTNDDADQAQKDEDDVPGANGGLRTALFHQVTTVGGFMRLSGFETNNRVRHIWSERVPTPGALALLSLAGMVAARRRR